MSKEKTIDGIKFVVTAFQAIEAFKLKSYLMKKFGPSLGQALGTLKGGLPASGDIGEVKLDGEAMSRAIQSLMEQLDEHDFIEFLKRMLRNVAAHVKGKQFYFTEDTFDASLDIVFTGKLFTVYPVLLLVLEANYPDFFDKVARGIGSKIKKIITSGPGDENSKNGSAESETSGS